MNPLRFSDHASPWPDPCVAGRLALVIILLPSLICVLLHIWHLLGPPIVQFLVHVWRGVLDHGSVHPGIRQPSLLHLLDQVSPIFTEPSKNCRVLLMLWLAQFCLNRDIETVIVVFLDLLRFERVSHSSVETVDSLVRLRLSVHHVFQKGKVLFGFLDSKVETGENSVTICLAEVNVSLSFRSSCNY